MRPLSSPRRGHRRDRCLVYLRNAIPFCAGETKTIFKVLLNHQVREYHTWEHCISFIQCTLFFTSSIPEPKLMSVSSGDWHSALSLTKTKQGAKKLPKAMSSSYRQKMNTLPTPSMNIALGYFSIPTKHVVSCAYTSKVGVLRSHFGVSFSLYTFSRKDYCIYDLYMANSCCFAEKYVRGWV